jgi:teichuronic acid biosynthesis glycosyltransferase TuaC
MKLLVLAFPYPYKEYTAAGIFNERSVLALRENCELVEVLVPKPLGASLFSWLSPRWKSYASMAKHELRHEIPIHRPGYLQIPRIAQAFWADPGVYFWCRGLARTIHRRAGFDAVLAFGLASVGGLAWRLGKDLGIPAIGWATGSDVRSPDSAAHGRLISRALEHLDLVFYQSHHLRRCAADLLGRGEHELPENRHVVLPRGIPAPPAIPIDETRSRVRKAWQISDDQTLVLYIGRIVKGKGIFDLLDAVKAATLRNSQITSVLVGSMPGFDDSLAVHEKLRSDVSLNRHARLVPSCDPEKVWELLCAADIFAFPSFGEGMPNALLEAMIMGVAPVAYAIPPVVELAGESGGLVLVPTGDKDKLAEAILGLSVRPEERSRLARRAKARASEQFILKKNMLEALRRIENLVHKSDELRACQHDGSMASSHRYTL